MEELTMTLWVLMHSDLRHTARVRTLVRSLVAALKADAPRIAGVQPSS